MPPRLARLLAVVVAVGLVAGAFVLRGALADDDADVETVGGPTDTDPERSGEETFQVLCDADLGEATCDALGRIDGVDEVRVATLAEVLTAAGTADDDPLHLATADAWLTLDGLPAVLDVARREAQLPPLTTEGAVVAVASSSLALLTTGTGPSGCDTPADWSCLVPAVRPSVAIPSVDTSLGTLVRAAAAVALEGSTDFGIGAYQGTPEADALQGLLGRSPSQAGASTDDQTLAMFNPGTASAAVTIEGLADLRAGTARGESRELRTIGLAPEATVGVALVGLGAQAEDAVAALGEAVTEQTVRDALAEAGWDGGPGPSEGLPDPDVVYALREELG